MKIRELSSKMLIFCFFFCLGPRVKKPKKPPSEVAVAKDDEKRPRTAFSGAQLARLKVIYFFFIPFYSFYLHSTSLYIMILLPTARV
jgi:hypothetical protein